MESTIENPTVQSLLGIKAANSLLLLEHIEDGLPFVHFVRLSKECGISEDALIKCIGISPRTLSRRKRDRSKFSARESDRIVSISRLFAKTLTLFEGDQEAAVSWLNGSNHAFDGRTPIDIASTENGIREVENLIGRLEHGVFI